MKIDLESNRTVLVSENQGSCGKQRRINLTVNAFLLSSSDVKKS